MLIAAIAAALLGQVAVPSATLPPATEPTVVFTHQGWTYIVGKTTGKVQAYSASISPEPGPAPNPTPDPAPPPVKEPIAYLSIVTDPTDPGQQAWRTNAELRKAAADAGVTLRTYGTNEAEVDTLGLRRFVNQFGLPAIVTQDRSGKVLKATRPTTIQDILDLVD